MRRYLCLALLALGLTTLLLRAEEPASKLLPPERSIEDAIDHYINAELKSAGVSPAAPADDAEFLRRVTLDLVGRIPTLAELTDYTAATDPDRKLRLVERLLASPGFVRHQSQEYYTLLRGDEPRQRKGGGGDALRGYLRTSFAENRPWDRIFREVLLPDESDAKTKGSSEFLKARVKDQNKLTVDVSSLFFGVNISCAQCHDHPHVPSWTQDHFYGMKSFFARVIENGGGLAELDAGFVKYVPNKGTEKVAPVMFLTGKTIDAPNVREPNAKEKKAGQERAAQMKKTGKLELPAFSLRAKLVETALAPDQRDFFARSAVNRVWHRFLARGLVMPLDQMHSENPASHPELLQWLARDLAEHGYDLRRLIRGIVLSNTYARGSRWDGEKMPEANLFAIAQVRPLAPQQMAASLKLAALDPEKLPADREALEKKLEAIEKSAERLSSNFAQPGDNFQVSASEALLFANNEELMKELLDGPDALPTRLQALPELAARADLAVRAVLGRPARAEEVAALTEYLQRRQDRPAAAGQQVVWALLTSAEFRFNH